MKAAGVLVLLAVAAGVSVWATWDALGDCSRRGGVLVKDYAGLPACVAAPSGGAR